MVVAERLRLVVPQSVRTAVNVTRYAGASVLCPLCGWEFRKFKTLRRAYPLPRPNAVCPRCSARERHRAVWLYLNESTDLLESPAALLHVAPEAIIQRRLSALPALRYVAGDLHPQSRDTVRLDVTSIPFDDESFDYVLCNHVLEHIPDDGRAMCELYRVLRPEGRAIMQQPIDWTRAETYEDSSITTPEGRQRAFHQDDHVRIYGRDFDDRLRAAGFTVSLARFEDARYGLATPVVVHDCGKSAR